ncbi:MAG: Stk1 family PASTA domain-containing Ser/Thr kinase [Chloroflexia bacterium]|nr:Stk1 family PASTA domain-containing Ser/Thr kinase [Chloroflexia bacterium]
MEATPIGMIELRATVNRRYRVDRQIGAGGMAVVYLGHDLLLGRDVAIKVLRPQYAANPTFRSRFEREAEAAAGFAHPNIIDIYDVGEEDGAPYIVMEHIAGHTLKEIIVDEGPFHPDDVAALLTQVAGALDYAHARGYVHRDVKPQNILVDDRGVARVVDFGIAKSLGDSDLTEIGAGLGTVHYLSPEQASGLMPTPASDIYSAGVVAFEMLTRRLPFEAESPVAVAMRHVQDPPPAPSSYLATVPAAVDAIVLKALAKDPTKRFQNAGALATAMSSWHEARPRPAPTPAPFRPPPSGQAPSDLTATTVTPAVVTEPESPLGPAAKPSPAAPSRDDTGCATWVIGLAVLLGLVGLIWIGFQLTPRIADLGGITTNPTVAVAPAAATTTGPAATNAPPAIMPAAAIAVPDFTGLTLTGATAAARAAGLQLSALEPVFSDSVPVDAVAEQDPPAASSVDQATTVYVMLSRGSAMIDLGELDLIETEAAAAERTLTASGLTVTREEVPSEEIAAGRVAGTEPADQAFIGDRIVLLVSLGDVVRIPAAIQGQPGSAATSELEAAGLVVTGEVGVGEATIAGAGLDLDTAGIEPGDVVGVQGDDADFDSYLPRGTEIELVVYDPALDDAE